MYDDFAVLGTEHYSAMAKEYNNQQSGKILSVKKADESTQLLEDVSRKFYDLSFIVNRLLEITTNSDAIGVLNEIEHDINTQSEIIKGLIETGVSVQNNKQIDVERYCNNLKLALQVCGEIIKELISIKDRETTSGEAKFALTNVIGAMIDINNKIVSLFGECRYRNFSLRRR